ncbi:hypothetical protein OPQ81_002942 [Rhizoctonia solani]|nr:hypothetical protein OPQ81_002942 [Rhizoctonia solani]
MYLIITLLGNFLRRRQTFQDQIIVRIPSEVCVDYCTYRSSHLWVTKYTEFTVVDKTPAILITTNAVFTIQQF